MKKHSTVTILCGAMGAGIVACVTGCATPRPESLQVTERDNAIYVDADSDTAKRSPDGKFKVSVAVSAGTFSAFGDVRDTIDAGLVESLSQFSRFQVSEFSRLGELEKVLSAVGEEDAITGWIDADSLDALVVAKINSITVDSREGLVIVNGKRQYSFDVSLGVDFRMYDKTQRQVAFTKSVFRSDSGLAEADVRRRLGELARDCVEEFAKAVGSRFSPQARVLQTRGSGLVARISIGKDHGLSKGAEIEFYEIVDNSAIVASAKRDKNIVGRGYVFEVDANSAWVEVLEHKIVNVKRGQYAAIMADEGNQRGLNPVSRFFDRARMITK